MEKNEARRNALAAYLKELETIAAPLMPTEPYPGIVMEPDFRGMKIPSPSPSIVEAAIDAVKDYPTRQELTERARRLEADLTNFDCNKRRFYEECADMRVADERRTNGTLSDAPEALKQLRRNLKGDIARLQGLIDGTAEGQSAQPPVRAVLVDEQAEQLANAAHDAGAAALDSRISMINTNAIRDGKLKTLSEASRRAKEAAKQAGLDGETGQPANSADQERKAILDEAKKLLKEWDEKFPNRKKPPRDEAHSDNAAFLLVANRHKGANGKPIMTPGAIKKALQRAKGEKRGKYARTGRARGKYTPQT